MFLDKSFIVTGASSGIGKAISLFLLEKGSTVYGLGRSVEAIEKFPLFFPIAIDLNDLDVVENITKELTKKIGYLDGLICAAGFGRFGGLEQFSRTQILSMINVNFTAHVLMTKIVLPIFKAQKSGYIIFLGSEAALSGSKNGSIYCASKFALRGFAQSLRADCAKSSVKISVINPGMVDTAFFETLSFSPGELPENFISTEDVTNIVDMILKAKTGTVYDEINLSPLKKVIQFDSS